MRDDSENAYESDLTQSKPVAGKCESCILPQQPDNYTYTV
jgi:hypothetical protein